MIKITIDNIVLDVNEGEYILQIARGNGIFIPSICYLTKCSPTLACKLCMVEIDGKRFYACNVKAKDGMNIVTNTQDLQIERKAIMQSYVVNHPLECGVCDKSGECELQDFTHLFGVDSQDFFVADSYKKMDFWSQVKYDPSLCILCERCVTTCKDNLGESNIKSIKADFPQLDSAFWKAKMPKDAFSVWNRKQKSIIGFVGENDCFDCAECVSVCPVGALGVKSFQYTSNAWELDKISSTCTLCPSGCKIIYERKRDIDGVSKIYRVTNDFNFNPICAGGRFAYDINPNLDNNNLKNAAEQIKNSSYIEVGGNITNNEALFLKTLKDKLNIKLINPLLKKYSTFMDILLDSGMKLSKLEDISQHKVLLTLGSSIKYENPLVRYKINNTLKLQKDSYFIYNHLLKDKLISKLSKNYFELNVQNEDILILAILNILYSDNALLDCINDTKKTIDYKISKEIIKITKEMQKDEHGNEIEISKEAKSQEEIIEKRLYYGIFEDSNLDYESYLKLKDILEKSKPLIIIGSDIYYNNNLNYIAKVLGALVDKIDVLIIPPSPNANGICSIVDFDNLDALDKKSVGFRTKGDYVIDSVNCDFKIPYFHSLNDNITNIDYKVLPLNAALDSNNYLFDLAKALKIDFTIPNIILNNDFSNNGNDSRGMDTNPIIRNRINNINFVKNKKLAGNAYLRDLSAHFYPYTKYSDNFQSKIGFYVSQEKLESLSNEFGIKQGDNVKLSINDNEVSAKIYIDYDMNDDYWAISPQISDILDFFGNSKYCKVRIIK